VTGIGLRVVTGLRAKCGKWPHTAGAVAAVAMLAAGCSVTTGDAGSSTSSSGAASTMSSMSFPAAEKSTLNVSVVPAMDSAGFFVALHQGLFAQEGLTIHYTPATSSDTVISQQAHGQYDITAGNYVSYMRAEMNHQANLEVVAEGSVMEQGSQVIFTMPHSNVKSLNQLSGHMVGVNAQKNIDYLLSQSVLQENGISGVNYPSEDIPFPNMASFLSEGKISAAVMPEPFASQAMQNIGAVPLADLNQGATQNFPIEGYVVTKQWAQQNPNTLKRFLAALEAGQEIADTNRTAVEKAFESLNGPQNGQVPTNIAAVMALNSYPIGIDEARLQRVSDVMYQFGLESGQSQAFQVSSMLMPSRSFNFTPFESNQQSSSS
jgi:NitT/TauT family transport system substrate-binding protein